MPSPSSSSSSSLDLDHHHRHHQQHRYPGFWFPGFGSLAGLGFAASGMASGMRQIARHVRATPWLCDGLVLGATVATISSTSALAYSSALMRFPKVTPPPAALYALGSAASGILAMDSACHECNALRLFALKKSPPGVPVSPLLGFSMDSLLTEMIMSFLISFVIVTFSVFLVREMR